MLPAAALWLAAALLAAPAPAGGGDSPGAGRRKASCAPKGCGARAAGEACGVYTPGCARGLRCVPRPGERAPLQALLRGKGVCLAAAVGPTAGAGNQTAAGPGPGDGWKETGRTGPPTQQPLLLQSQGLLPDLSVGNPQLQQLSLSSDTKQELETGPCRMHLTAVLKELKAPLYLSGEDIFIPNCDTKGFYRQKQCRASKGQRRGRCWCVDKRGHRLEGLDENPLCLLPGSD